MNSTTERIDPASDIRPEPKHGSHKLVYILVFVLGAALILLGAYARYAEKSSWFPEVCIAAGVAIAAPGILSYMYRKYLLEEIKHELQAPALAFKEQALTIVQEAINETVDTYRKELGFFNECKNAGISGVHISRAEAIQSFIPFIEEEPHELIIIGSSLRGLLQEPEKEYEDARRVIKSRVEKGVKLRILLTHPRIADMRAKQEDRNYRDIGKEILTSLRYLLEQWKIPREDIRLYLGTPTCFGIKTTKAVLLNTYPNMKEAFASPCLIVRKPGYFYEHFANSHFKAWSSSIACDLPPDLRELESHRDLWAREVEKLIEHSLDHSGKKHSSTKSPEMTQPQQ